MLVIPETLKIPTLFETEHTTVREFALGDTEAFWNLIEKNRHRLEESFPQTVYATTSFDACCKLMEEKVLLRQQNEYFGYGIWHKATNTMMGYFCFKNIDWKVPKAESAYFIAAAYEGQGVMTEVMKAAILFGFTHLCLNRLYIRVLTNNAASKRLAEKCGFEEEGTLRNDFVLANGELQDVSYWSILPKNTNA